MNAGAETVFWRSPQSQSSERTFSYFFVSLQLSLISWHMVTVWRSPKSRERIFNVHFREITKILGRRELILIITWSYRQQGSLRNSSVTRIGIFRMLRGDLKYAGWSLPCRCAGSSRHAPRGPYTCPARGRRPGVRRRRCGQPRRTHIEGSIASTGPNRIQRHCIFCSRCTRYRFTMVHRWP